MCDRLQVAEVLSFALIGLVELAFIAALCACLCVCACVSGSGHCS